jgi:diguanylate cyclase (GGDEF)-like protein/hemerythrin-like metal-binding protein
MDNKTLALSYIIVAVALFLTSLTIAIYRKERSFKIFACAFAASAIGVLLIGGQGTINLWISVILGNILMLLNYLLLMCGIRAFYKELVIWPKHFWYYVIAYYFAFVYATFVHYSFILRTVVYTVFLVIIMIEFYFYLRPRLLKVPRIIRNAFQSVIFGYLVIYIVRVILILIAARHSSILINNDIFSGFTFIMSIVSLIFWFSALQLLDSYKLLEAMKEKNNLLDSMARTDKLTGIYNRYYLEQNIKDYMELSDRLGEPISFILVDLDHFKDVNDRYGHAVGDEVLVRTVKIIKDTIRATDKAIRWGGEEFLILAIATSKDDATILAEKIRNAIASKGYGTVGHVTASFGVAERFYSESQDMCFKRVDIALYKAKNSGRNCVVSWNSSDQLPIALVKIEWLDKWSSGNDLIDNDHRMLIELSNRLIESTFVETSTEIVAEQINLIFSHLVQHFEKEEQILQRIAYPELDEHLQSHKDLLQETEVIKDIYMNGNSNITDLIGFLVGKVVLGHLLMMDTKFFTYTRAEKQNVE